MILLTLPFKRWSGLFAAFFLILGCSNLSAQKSAEFKKAKTYIETNLAQYGLAAEDIADMKVRTEYTDEQTGITHIYIQQTSNGIEIMDGSMGVHLKDGVVRYATSNFEKEMTQRRTSVTPSLSASSALQAAAENVGIILNETAQVLSEATTPSRATVFSKGNLAAEDIPAKLVYKKNKEGQLALCWLVQIYETSQQHDWHVFVDASTGKVIEKDDFVLHCDFGGTPHVTDAPEDSHAGHAHNHNHNHNHNHAHKTEKADHIVVAAELPGIPQAQSIFDRYMVMDNTYRVFAEPIEAPHTVTNGHQLTMTNGDAKASPFGWHSSAQGVFNNTTTGNNAVVRNQVGAVSPPGTPPDHPAVATNGAVVPPFIFDYPADLTQGPETYTDAAIVNLFYWNNIMHDVFYGLGFDEKAGNFQTNNNFGINEDRRRTDGTMNGGGDHVLAEAQDGEATNNANMRTLPDGVSPIMQMYLWTSNPPSDLVFLNTINGLPVMPAIAYAGIEGAFGTNNRIPTAPAGIVGNLVAMDANSQAPGSDIEGCGTGAGAGLVPDNAADMAGNIVLISRGSCSFIEKILSAQAGGATAAIVFNNIPGADGVSMGGDESGSAVVIPTCMISQPAGQALLDQLNAGDMINLRLQRDVAPLPQLDGDFDNGIIAHEYGHGISNRLTGGPDATGPLGGDEQAGEGWSDFMALYMTTQSSNAPGGTLPNRGIGTYVIYGSPTDVGIRPARYSYDFSVNDYTYANVTNPEITVPHGVGFIWCTMIYDMMQNIIDMVPINDNLYLDGIEDGSGGNNIAMRLVMEGMKMQATDPTFVEMRDAILQADAMLFNGEYNCAIWQAFARRGLGTQATSGTNGLGDENENFDLPIGCGGEVNALLTMTKTSVGVLENEEEITFTITLTNTSTLFDAEDVVITDVLPPNMTFVSASDGGTESNGTVTFPAIPLIEKDSASASVTVTVSINTPGDLTDLIFDDNIENGTAEWVTNTSLGAWETTTDDPFSGDNAWFAINFNGNQDATLTLANPITIPAGLEMSFFHKYATEFEYDGGVVEISIDGGVSWATLGPQMTQNGYNSNVSVTNNPLLAGPAFTGTSGGYIETLIDLNSFAGRTALIRFRMSSDVATAVDGWRVDDIRLFINPVYEVNSASAISSTADPVSTSARVLMLPNNALPVELLSFNATADRKNINLEWATATEINNKGFFIERSTNPNERFTEIDFVEGRGGSTRTSYQLLDTDVVPNVRYYYRLRQVDFDGAFEYSPIRTAEVKGREQAYKVQPNPTQGNFEVQWINAEDTPEAIQVMDVSGKLVASYQPESTALNRLSIDIGHLPNNLYFVKIRSSSEVITKKLLLQR